MLMIPATLSAELRLHAACSHAAQRDRLRHGTGGRWPKLVRAGFRLNLIGILLITVWTYLVGPLVFGIDHGVVPVWAR